MYIYAWNARRYKPLPLFRHRMDVNICHHTAGENWEKKERSVIAAHDADVWSILTCSPWL